MRQGRLDEAEREIVVAAEQLDAWRESLDDRQLQLLGSSSSGIVPIRTSAWRA